MIRYEKLGAAIADVWIRRRDLNAVDVREALSAGGNGIVFLPEDPDLIGVSAGLAVRLCSWFSPLTLCIVSRTKFAPPLSELGFPHLTILNGVTWTGLPTGEALSAVRKLAPRIAIDLHPVFNLPTAYLCVESRAALRIGFDDRRHQYFNLRYSLRDGINSDGSDRFASFFAILEDLRTETGS
jgi:hypothetical protein